MEARASWGPIQLTYCMMALVLALTKLVLEIQRFQNIVQKPMPIYAIAPSQHF